MEHCKEKVRGEFAHLPGPLGQSDSSLSTASCEYNWYVIGLMAFKARMPEY